MAAGDVYVQGIESIADQDYFSIKPPVGTEVVIHNICHTVDASLEFYDEDTGHSIYMIDKQLSNGAWMGMFLHCTNTKYYRVQNIAGEVNFMSCDGVITKEA